MTQIRTHQFRDDDTTRSLNTKLQGVIEYGLYRGFDHKPFTSGGLILELQHEDTGYDAATYDYPADRLLNVGVWVSRQGVTIKETSSITLEVPKNTTEHPRIDRIVGISNYRQVQGGEPTLYALYMGAASSNPQVPGDPDNPSEVTLGLLYVPPNMESLNEPGVRYVKSTAPDFAGQRNIVRTDRDADLQGRIVYGSTGMRTGVAIITRDPFGTSDFCEVKVDPNVARAVVAAPPGSGNWVIRSVAKWDGDDYTSVDYRVGDVITLEITANNPSTVYLDSAYIRTSAIAGTPGANGGHLKLHTRDVVTLVKDAGGPYWTILNLQTGQYMRRDREVAMEQRFTLNKAAGAYYTAVVIDGEPIVNALSFLHNTNVVEISANNNLTIRNIVSATSLFAITGYVEPREGQELTIIPKYTGSSPDNHRLTLGVGVWASDAPAGNLWTPSGTAITVPWDRPFKVISVGTGGNQRWMLTEHISGISRDITAEYFADARGALTRGGTGELIPREPGYDRAEVAYKDGRQILTLTFRRATDAGTTPYAPIEVKMPAPVRTVVPADVTNPLVGMGVSRGTVSPLENSVVYARKEGNVCVLTEIGTAARGDIFNITIETDFAPRRV